MLVVATSCCHETNYYGEVVIIVVAELALIASLNIIVFLPYDAIHFT